MGCMDYVDPGGAGRGVLNPGGVMDPVMPYLGQIGGAVGSVIGGVYGGPAGAGLGGWVGGSGGTQLGSYLSHNPGVERGGPFSGEVMGDAAKTGAISGVLGAAGTYGAQYLSGLGAGSAATTNVGASEFGAGGGGGISGAGSGGASAMDMPGYSPITSSLVGYSPTQDGAGSSSVLSSPESQNPTGDTLARSQIDQMGEGRYGEGFADQWGGEPYPYGIIPTGNDYFGSTNSLGGMTSSSVPLETTSIPTETSSGPMDYSMIGRGSQSQLDTPVASSSSLITKPAPGGIGNYAKGATPYLMGAGIVSNLVGQYMNSQQQKSNLGDYTKAVTWNPESAAAYQNAMGQNVAGVYGGNAARAKGTLAESMAAAGRGGGNYGAQAMGIEERNLNAQAAARNQALTTTSTPPNLNAAPFMGQTNPYGSTAVGVGGLAGNMANNEQNLQYLRMLGYIK